MTDTTQSTSAPQLGGLTNAQIRGIAAIDGGLYQDDETAKWSGSDAALMAFARAILEKAAPEPQLGGLKDEQILIGFIDLAIANYENGKDGYGKSILEQLKDCIRTLMQAPVAKESLTTEMPVQAAPEDIRSALYIAATSCSHSIDAEEVILRRDSKKPGNALSQLADRLGAAYATISAPVQQVAPEVKSVDAKPSTLSQQVKAAQAEYRSWSNKDRVSVQLQGGVAIAAAPQPGEKQ